MDEQRGARSLAQAKPEVQIRLEPHVLERVRVAGLGRAMRGEERVARVRRERDREQRRRAGDEPVERYRNAPRGARQDHARQAADLESADLRQHVEAVARARLSRQHVHRSAAAREVLDHLGGHDLGVGADTLGDDAVVGGEREDDGSRDFRRAPAQNGEAQRDLLEPTETSGRLGQAIEMAPGGALSVARARLGRGEKPGEPGHAPTAGAFTVRGMPATISTTAVHTAATRWFTPPSRSRNLSPIAVSGCTPSPTSFDTRVKLERRRPISPASASASSRIASSRSPRSRRFETQSVRQSTRIPSYASSRPRSRETRSHGASTVDQRCGRSARWRAMRLAMSSSHASAVATKTIRASGESRSTAKRLLPLRAPPTINSDGTTDPDPPSKTGERIARRAGLLALGSSYSPRLPGLAASGTCGFRPRSQ